MIKVSIIIPVYNVEKYLKKCMDTIFDQTLKEIEVICINDGSTDNSLNILNEYKEKHRNLVIYTQENAGSGSARNVGIRISKGEYLMFLDPDDYLAGSDVIEVLYNSARAKGVKVCGGSVILNKNEKLIRTFSSRQRKSRVEESIITCFSQYQYPYAHQRYIIKKDLLIENKIKYPLYRRGQDLPFITDVLNVAGPFYLINKDVYVYRKGYKKEIMSEKKVNDMMNSLHDVMSIAIDNGLEELFVSMRDDMHISAKEYWYKTMQKNNTWDKIVKINALTRKGNRKFGYDVNENCIMDRDRYQEYLNELNEEWEITKENIKQYKKIMIYGAGLKGIQIYKYLKEKGYFPYCFVVSDIKENESIIDEIPVIAIDKLEDVREGCFIIGVLDPLVQENIKKNLKKRGYYNIVEFNVDICLLSGLLK